MIKSILKKQVITVLIGAIVGSCILPTTEVEAQSNSSQVNNSSISMSRSSIKKGTITIDGVSVRSTNSSSGKYLGSLYTGDKVEIVQTTSNNWYKIKYKSGYAYIGTTYVKLDGTSSSTNVVLNTGTTTSNVNVRKTASSKGVQLGNLSKGSKVEVVDATPGGWYKIKYNKSYGYVSGKYVSLKKGDKIINYGEVYNASSLNVRKSPSTTSNKIGSLKRNQRVQIVKKESNGWYKIIFNNTYGYVSKDYIKITTSSRRNLDNFMFVGDSFTYGIRNTITSNNNHVYLQAQSGSRPSFWLDKVGQMPNNNSIEGISFLLGVNGVKYDNNINDAKKLLSQLMVKYPDKTIYVQKVFPVGTNYTENPPVQHNKYIKEYNKQMQEFCNSKSNLKFIDTTKGFVNDKGYLMYTDDGLHIKSSKSSVYYKNIFEAIKNNK